MNLRRSATSGSTGPAALEVLKQGLGSAFAMIMSWGRKVSVRRRNNRMQLCETLSLGDRRFLAVVLVEQQKFLVGGAPNSVALLAKLPARGSSTQFRDEVHLL